MNDNLSLTPAALHYARATDLAYSAAAESHRYTPVSALLPQIQSKLAYLTPTQERPYNYTYEPPDGGPWENYQHDDRTISICDARHMAAASSLDREGFQLWNAPSEMTDFFDQNTLLRYYYPEVAELACAATGATRAYVFDHLLRQRETDRRPLSFGRAAKGTLAGANGRVHNDYTEASGRKRLALVIGELAAQYQIARYSIVNVWRSIKVPVLDTPLAVCDARTLDVADLVSAEVRYPRRTGEIYLAHHAPRHRWYYFSAMDLHEALVFKQYDSQVSGVARYTPHAAFDHPDAPAGVTPRVSIEARCLVIYD